MSSIPAESIFARAPNDSATAARAPALRSELPSNDRSRGDTAPPFEGHLRRANSPPNDSRAVSAESNVESPVAKPIRNGVTAVSDSRASDEHAPHGRETDNVATDEGIPAGADGQWNNNAERPDRGASVTANDAEPTANENPNVEPGERKKSPRAKEHSVSVTSLNLTTPAIPTIAAADPKDNVADGDSTDAEAPDVAIVGGARAKNARAVQATPAPAASAPYATSPNSIDAVFVGETPAESAPTPGLVASDALVAEQSPPTINSSANGAVAKHQSTSAKSTAGSDSSQVALATSANQAEGEIAVVGQQTSDDGATADDQRRPKRDTALKTKSDSNAASSNHLGDGERARPQGVDERSFASTVNSATILASATQDQVSRDTVPTAIDHTRRPTPGLAPSGRSDSTDAKVVHPTGVGGGESSALRSSSGTVTGSGASTSGTNAPAQLSELDRVRFVQRVSRAFQTAIDRGAPLRLRLSPPELGALRLEVSLRDGAMSARIEAESPASHALLIENLPALRERLTEQNIRIERFDVGLLGQSPGQSQEQQSRNAFGERGSPREPGRTSRLDVGANPQQRRVAGDSAGSGHLNVIV